MPLDRYSAALYNYTHDAPRKRAATTEEIVIRFYERLCSIPEDQAVREIRAMSDTEVANFWHWNDREASSNLRDASGEEWHEIVDSLRESLERDVVAEIRFRARI